MHVVVCSDYICIEVSKLYVFLYVWIKYICLSLYINVCVYMYVCVCLYIHVFGWIMDSHSPDFLGL